MMPTLDEATADPPGFPQEFPKDLLSAWMRHMESYGQVWYEDIGRDYFSQEYWYLLVIAMVRYWRHEPLYIGDACDCMKTGSARTRETRLRRLFDASWLEKAKNPGDRRQTYVLPTPDMQRIVGTHLRRSLSQATRFAHHSGIVTAADPLAAVLETADAGATETYLVPWAEFLVGYTDDWNATFSNRFHTEEYWHPFVHCLLASWADQPLTMGEACQAMRTGSNRTRENRIVIAITRKLLARQKSDTDMRTTLVLPTPALERHLVGHFGRTLGQLQRLLRSLVSRATSVDSRAETP